MAQPNPSQQQINQQQQQRRTEDHVTKVRELVSGPLKAKWQETLRHASEKINNTTVIAASAGVPVPPNNSTSFESSLEDFFSVCDQIEANLRTALEIHVQSSSSLRYMTIPPAPNRVDLTGSQQANPDGLSYQQYLQTAKQQAQFTSETRSQLIKAANDASDVVKQQQQQQQQQQQ